MWLLLGPLGRSLAMQDYLRLDLGPCLCSFQVFNLVYEWAGPPPDLSKVKLESGHGIASGTTVRSEVRLPVPGTPIGEADVGSFDGRGLVQNCK